MIKKEVENKVLSYISILIWKHTGGISEVKNHANRKIKHRYNKFVEVVQKQIKIRSFLLMI